MNEALKKILSFIYAAVIGFALGCGTHWYASRCANQRTSAELRDYQQRAAEMSGRLSEIGRRCENVREQLGASESSIQEVVRRLYVIADEIETIEYLVNSNRLDNSRSHEWNNHIQLIESVEAICTETGTYYAEEE